MMKQVCRFFSRIVLNHPVASVFFIALIARILTVVYVSWFHHGTVFPDDQTYMSMVRDFAHYQTAEWSDYQHWLWDVSASFLLPAGLLSRALGFHYFLVLFLSALAGSCLTGLATRLLSNYVSATISFFCGVTLALLPSQVLWSSLLLKDSYIAMALVGLTLIIGWWSDKKNSHFIYGVLAIVALLLYVERIRLHSLMVVCIAFVLTALLFRSSLYFSRLVVACLLMILVPWAAWGGPAGINYFRTLSGGMEDQRLAGAIGANTAIITTPPSPITTPTSPNTNPNTSPNTNPNTNILNQLEYLPAGLKVMIVDPTPSQLSQSKSLWVAFAEHIIWYPALFLAMFAIARRRKWPMELLFAVMLWFGLASMWGLVEGNLGTAFRHRTEFVWIVFLFAGIGVQQLVDDKKAWNVRQSMAFKPGQN